MNRAMEGISKYVRLSLPVRPEIVARRRGGAAERILSSDSDLCSLRFREKY